jgi:hypothetical protein
VNLELRTVRVTSKPELGFYPKRWEDREIPAPVELIEELRAPSSTQTDGGATAGQPPKALCTR